MQPDDVLRNKCAIIERCIRRMHEEYASCPTLDNFTHVDAIVLNMERACQATIDLGMHIVAARSLGIPQSSAQTFDLLCHAGLISAELAGSLKRMVGFRNIAIHDYQELDQAVLFFILRQGYQDLIRFCAELGVRIQGPSQDA